MNTQITDRAKRRRDEIVVRAFRSLYSPLCGYVRKWVGDIYEVEDLVPWWDFNDPCIPQVSRDASAGNRERGENSGHPTTMNKTRIFLTALLCASSFMMQAQTQNSLTTYPAPEGMEMTEDFEVKVRIPGGGWQDVPTHMVKVDEVRGTRHCIEKASLTYFDFEGEVEVRVTSVGGPVNGARIRPLSYGIVPKVEGNTLTFTLDKPRNLSVKVDGDIFHNLHLFANPEDCTTVYATRLGHKGGGGNITMRRQHSRAQCGL